MKSEVLDCIKTRRSIRKFEAKPVPQDKLDAILEAGTYAPTGMGLQDVQIVAVQEEETRRQLTRMNAEILETQTDPYYAPPVIILVFANRERNTCVQDGSCVLMNMLLAAHAVGLGACWINREREMFETQEGKALMKKWGLEEGMAGVGAISLGTYKGSYQKRQNGRIIM